MGSLSNNSLDEVSTHVDLSDKKDVLEITEPQPKRRSSIKLKLADFTLVRTLGTGSFGRVHLAQWMLNKEFYAIKVLKKKDVINSRQVEHVKSERAILTRVKDSFIVNMWSSFQDDANLYMVMDYVPGGELFSYMKNCKVNIKKKKKHKFFFSD